MNNSGDWREFEQLVARIEAIASPKGAIVKSPDRLPDLVTQRTREVDASIRYRIGSVDILITIECRKRSRKADDIWIEQLATKRSKIGAAKTIAVSSRGFSDSAAQTASHHGIELRTLSEVSSKDLEDWFLPTAGVVHIFRKIEQMKCVVFLECSDGGPTDYGLLARDEFEPIFHHDRIHSPFPAATLFHFHELLAPEAFSSVPLNGTLTQIKFGLDGRGVLTVNGEGGRLPVHHVQMSAMVGYEVADLALESGQHLRYISPDGSAIQRTTFDAKLFGLPFEFEHQEDPKGKSHVAYRIKPKPTK